MAAIVVSGKRLMAASLGVVAPGAGQILTGDRGLGLLWFAATAAGYRAFLPLGLLIHALAAIHSARLGEVSLRTPGLGQTFVLCRTPQPRSGDPAVSLCLACILAGLVCAAQLAASGTKAAPAGGSRLLAMVDQAPEPAVLVANSRAPIAGSAAVGTWSVPAQLHVTNVAWNLVFTAEGPIVRLARSAPVCGLRAGEARMAFWSLLGGKTVKGYLPRHTPGFCTTELYLPDGRNVTEEAAKVHALYLIESPRRLDNPACAASLADFGVRFGPVAEDGDSYTISGHVRNKTPRNIDTIWLRISAYDASGQLVQQETTASEGPVMPGQSRPFRLVGRRSEVRGATRWQIVAMRNLW